MIEQVLHKGLTPERWNRFPLDKRLGMIASEFSRAQVLIGGDRGREYARECYERADELARFTLRDSLIDQAIRSLLDEVRQSIEHTDFEKTPSEQFIAQSRQLEERLSAVQWAIHDGKDAA